LTCTASCATGAAGARSSSCTTARPTPTATSISHRAQQGAQGHRRALAVDDGLRRAVRAGLGLPWPAHRVKLLKELGPKKKDMSVGDLRRRAARTPSGFVDVQREQFKRLGVLGDWSDPYLTMDYRVPGGDHARAGRFVEQGMGVQGQEAVTGASHCRTALAEASGVRAARVAVDLREFRLTRRAPGNWPRASRARRPARWSASSGRPRRGRFRRTWALASIRMPCMGVRHRRPRGDRRRVRSPTNSRSARQPFDRPVAAAKGSASNTCASFTLVARDSVASSPTT